MAFGLAVAVFCGSTWPGDEPHHVLHVGSGVDRFRIFWHYFLKANKLGPIDPAILQPQDGDFL